MPRKSPKNVKPVIGLVGGIGAGKSSAAQVFASLGAAVIDSDRLAHDELRRPEVALELERWWGPSVRRADGSVDRRRVAEIVFDDPEQLARLEGLLYPRIAQVRDALMTQYVSDPAVQAIVLDAPKLYEAGVDRLCDVVVFVECERATRARRMEQARGWDQAEWERRENRQKPLDKKRAIADHVVTNNSGIDDLRPQITRVFASVLASFA